MLIPPKSLLQSDDKKNNIDHDVWLASKHICFSPTVTATIFGESLNAYVAYYPEKNSLMIAPVTEELFKTIHKASQHMLKAKSDSGHTSIALHEMIIDNEIMNPDGPLQFKIEEKLNLIKITF